MYNKKFLFNIFMINVINSSETIDYYFNHFLKKLSEFKEKKITFIKDKIINLEEEEKKIPFLNLDSLKKDLKNENLNFSEDFKETIKNRIFLLKTQSEIISLKNEMRNLKNNKNIINQEKVEKNIKEKITLLDANKNKIILLKEEVKKIEKENYKATIKYINDEKIYEKIKFIIFISDTLLPIIYDDFNNYFNDENILYIIYVFNLFRKVRKQKKSYNKKINISKKNLHICEKIKRHENNDFFKPTVNMILNKKRGKKLL